MILVTGSTGFIGSHLCRALAAQGERVRAFHRPSSPLAALDGLDLEHAVGDVTQLETLAAALQGVEVVFHAAAQMGRTSDPRQAYAVTVGGTRNLLEAAQRAGVRRVVHTSSVAALGVPDSAARGAPAPMDEHHTWNYDPAWWLYGHAKYQAELAVQRAVGGGLDVVMVNPTRVLGAGDLHRVNGNLVILVARGRVPVAPPGGLNVVHIEDVTRGHLAALEHGRTGERYILGAENLPYARFLTHIAEVTGARAPGIVLPAFLMRLLARPLSLTRGRVQLPVRGEMLRLAGYYFYYSIDKADRELGWRPACTVREAIAEAYSWYREQNVI